MSSPQSACAAGAGSGSARRPTRRACSAACRSSSVLASASRCSASLLGLSRPLGRVPGLRLAWRGRRRRAGAPRPGRARRRRTARAVSSTGASMRGLRRHDRRGHHGRDRRRHRTAPLRGQVQLVRGTAATSGAGAGQRRGAAGDGDGRHGGDADTAQDGRGQGTRDRGCVRRAAGPVRLPNSRTAGAGGPGARGGLGGSDAEPRPTFRTRRRRLDVRFGGTGGWGVPCPFRDRVVMNPLMNLGPLPRVTTPRATTVRHRAPNAFLTPPAPPAFMSGNTARLSSGPRADVRARRALPPRRAGDGAAGRAFAPEPDDTERTTGRTPCTSS